MEISKSLCTIFNDYALVDSFNKLTLRE